MNHVNAKLATELKKAGFPQPAPQPGQFWYNDRDEMHIVLSKGHGWHGKPVINTLIKSGSIEDIIEEVFLETYSVAPTLEDIAPLLPECLFETWDGSPSCKYLNDEQPIRAFGTTFAEAAAKMWLILYT